MERQVGAGEDPKQASSALSPAAPRRRLTRNADQNLPITLLLGAWGIWMMVCPGIAASAEPEGKDVLRENLQRHVERLAVRIGERTLRKGDTTLGTLTFDSKAEVVRGLFHTLQEM